MAVQKHRRKLYIIMYATALLIVLIVASPMTTTAHADGESLSSYSMSSYEITCTINEDSSALITEIVTLSAYDGYFTRTIPLSDKVRVRDVRLYIVTEDDDEAVYTEAKYSVTSEKNSVTIKSKGKNSSGDKTFAITYKFVNLPLSPNKSDDTLYITNIGAGWSGSIGRPTITVVLPNGFIAEKSEVYHGPTDDVDANAVFIEDEDGRVPTGSDRCEKYLEDDTTIVYTPYEDVSSGIGISFSLYFNKGVMSSSTVDFLPWLLLLICLAIVGVIIALRLTKFNTTEHIGRPHIIKRNYVPSQNSIVTTSKETDSTSPYVPVRSMDPITYRRIQENKIEDADVISLLFFWAEKGFIRINPKNEGNPVLIKTIDVLPEECPDTWKELFNAIFVRTDKASIKSVSRHIYPQIAAIRDKTNKIRETSFSKKSIGIASLFAVLAALFVSFLPVFLPMRVSPHAFTPIYFVTIIPALLIFVFFAAIYATRHECNRKMTMFFTVMTLIYSVACVALYCVFVPSVAFGLAPQIIASLLTVLAEISAASFILHSDEYNEKLREVNDVKEFILSTSPNNIERITQDNPYIYYEFLPYALILKIGIPWSDKFKGTMPTPSWLVMGTEKARFTVIRETIRNTYEILVQNTIKNTTNKKKNRR